MSKKRRSDIGEAFYLAGRVFGKIFVGFLSVILTILLICLITGTIVAAAFALYIDKYIDAGIEDFEVISVSSDMTTTMYYMDYSEGDGSAPVPVEMENERLYGAENRIWVPYDQIPAYLVEAFVSIEDHRFWTHGGVDWWRTCGATLYYFTGKASYGGSTITQQLIKNVTGDNDVTIQRKVQEILRALELEKKYEKEEILELYLNLIYFSQGCYGVQAASHKYFNKDVSELNLLECAAIAGIIQAPTKWDPILNPENNKERRNDVIYRMWELGKITDEEYEENYDKDLELHIGSIDSEDSQLPPSSTSSWYGDAVFDEAVQLIAKAKNITPEIAERLMYTGGFKIYTAYDPEIQGILDDYFKNDENFAKVDDSVIQPEASMVIVNPYNGNVVAIAGGRGDKSLIGNRVLNYATMTTRSPGSSIKPLSVYAPAIELGYVTYGTAVDDTPINFGTESYNQETGRTAYSDRDGWPNNYPAGFRGLTTVHDAVKRSVNTVAVRTLQMVGEQTAFDFVKNKLHMDSFIERKDLANGGYLTDINLSALALGGMNYGVTVEEITAAYGVFVNDGIYNKPRTVLKILDSEGKVIVNNEVESTVVFKESTAAIMTKILESVVSSGGTASSITLKSKVDVAGKTGTTTADVDRWFVGYTPYYVAGVWFGYATPQNLNKFSASKSPAVQIWDDVMTLIHQKYIDEAENGGNELKEFGTPDNIITATYCKDSGLLITDACRADPRGSRAETGYFTISTAPKSECNRHVMVEYDAVTGGIANAGCPEENVTKVGLLRVPERKFPVSITVVDSPYLYFTESELADIAQSGLYTGNTGENRYNVYCTKHSNTDIGYEDDDIPELGDEDFILPPLWPFYPDEDPEDTGYEDEPNIPVVPDTAPVTTPPVTAPPETTPPETTGSSGPPPGYIW